MEGITMNRNEMREDIRLQMGLEAIRAIKESLKILQELPPSDSKDELIEQTEKTLKEAQEHLA
tara:strand:+ start:403 stop:591 length:189 start_codon:yes stop_codon:yes gene_type:complete